MRATSTTAASDFQVRIGDQVTFRKTVGEHDVYAFAGITGDLSPNHVDEAGMQATPYGGRIAHGALLVGYMSTAATLLMREARKKAPKGEFSVSQGYDRIRFLKGVRFGDTITVRYAIAEIDPVRRRSRSNIEILNQAGETVAVGHHIIQWVRQKEAP